MESFHLVPCSCLGAMNAQFHNYTASLYFKRRDSKTDDGDRAISGISFCLKVKMIRGIRVDA